MIKIGVLEDKCTPTYQTLDSAGGDVIAYSIKKAFKGVVELPEEKVKELNESFERNGHIYLRPFERMLFSTGVILQHMNNDLEIQVRTRSGLALKKGVVVANSPGTIDADYRSEIGVILYNTTPFLSKILRDERIAQLVVNKIEKTNSFNTVKSIRDGGYGSTNK